MQTRDVHLTGQFVRMKAGWTKMTQVHISGLKRVGEHFLKNLQPYGMPTSGQEGWEDHVHLHPNNLVDGTAKFEGNNRITSQPGSCSNMTDPSTNR